MGGSENLAVVEAMFADFAAGRADQAFAHFDDEVMWDSRSLTVPELTGIFMGHEGVRRWWWTWLGAWEHIEIVSGPHNHVHGNQIVSVWRQSNLGKGSGVAVEQEAGLIWTFENDRIVRVSVFTDCAAALRAAGIEERGGGVGARG